MTNPIFDQLDQTFEKQGANAALSELCERLRQEKDYENLFYARLMAKRHELGLTPVPTSPMLDVPDEKQEELETGIREACREVGQLYLADGSIPQSWTYFRMIGDGETITKAIDDYQPQEDDEQVEDIIQIAFNEGVHPKKGFDWILDRFGICSAITTLGSQQTPGGEDVRRYCVGRTVWALHEELRERLINDVEHQEGKRPEEATSPARTLGVIRKLMQGRFYLFEEDGYHVDLSHLSNAVQMSMELEPGEDLEAARELCEYGVRLKGGFQVNQEPPFDEQYKDYQVYLSAVAGERQEEAVAHFRAKAENYPVEEYGSGCAEVLVQLLLRLDRVGEAAEVARKYLAELDVPRLAYVAGLCDQAKDYETLMKTAREQNNPVQYLAGLLASGSK